MRGESVIKMSHMKVFQESDPRSCVWESDEQSAIAKVLAEVGIRFEQWPTHESLQAGSSADEVLSAYSAQIKQLCDDEGYQTVDVISLNATNPEIAANVPQLREKFLSEHTHSEDEVRFFVAGQGLFSLHLHEKVFEVLCQRGDLISVPAGTEHWFDMGARPNFAAIRFFNNPEGWVANYTGKRIAESFSRLEY